MSCYSEIRILLSIFIIFFDVTFVQSQFELSCQNLPNYGVAGDTFCAAACGTGATATCSSPDGLCQCNYACGAAAPSPLFNAALCPAPAPTPALPAGAVAGCTAACQDPSICANPGGSGDICGTPSPLDPAGTTFLAICTCYCPPSPCPVTNSTTSIALLPVLIPNPLKAFKYKFLLYLLKGIILLAKLIALTLLKILTFSALLLLNGGDDGGGLKEDVMQGWGGYT